MKRSAAFPLSPFSRVTLFCLLAMTLAVAGAAAFSRQAAAAESPYPTRPVRLIVPSSPGGGTDLYARLIATRLGETWGQQFVIDNRPGVSGALGAEIATHAPADGYTLLMASVGFTVSPSMMRTAPYDPVKDFSTVIHVTSVANVLAVHPSLAASNMKGFIELAKAKPGELAYGSAGPGSSPQMSMELLRSMTGIDLIHVPFKGVGPSVVGLLGGQVVAAFPNITLALPHAKAGKLRALAVTSKTRSTAAPDVPAIAETVPGYESVVWYGLFTPAGAPRPVIEKLNREINRILNLPEIEESIAREGAVKIGGTPESFAAFVKGERTKWEALVKRAGLRAY